MESILIVEKDDKEMQVIQEALQEEYKLFTCSTHEEAITFLKHKIPDLILAEDFENEVSVMRLLEYVKRTEDMSRVPLVILSNGEDEQFERRCMRLGAYDFIFKPCSKVGLLSRVRRALEFQQQLIQVKQSVNISQEHLDEIIDQAHKDALTRLLNRTCSEDMINNFLMERRNHGALLMLDMDNFKMINDRYGHIIGDEVLVEFANTLMALTRRDDIVCRLGGDEFVVFLKDVASHACILEKVEQLIMTLESRILLPDDKEKISVSTGIAVSPGDGRSFKQLYQNADKALYCVKQNNKGSYRFYSEEGNINTCKSARKSTQVDLEHLCSFIQEVGYQKGAYQVEYDGFKKIYRFLSRCIGRLEKDAQIVLFTLHSKEGHLSDVEEMVFAMDNLKNAVHESIRHGDVATNYSSSQFVIILMGSTTNDGEMVAERICKKFNELHCYNPDIELGYDIQIVAPVAAEWN